MLLALPSARAVILRELSGGAGATALLPLDGGNVAALVPGASGGVEACLLTSADEVARTLIASNAFFQNTCLHLSASPDGSCLWCVVESTDPNNPRRIYHAFPAGDARWSGSGGIIRPTADMPLQRLLPLTGETALLHDGNVYSLQGIAFADAAISTVGDAFALPDDRGLLPAASADGTNFFYPISTDGESEPLMRLAAYDRTTGTTTILLENLGYRQTYLNGNKTFGVNERLIRAVRVSQAGDVVLLRWCNGKATMGTLGIHVALMAQDAEGAWSEPILLDECRSTENWEPACGDFALSADGRLAVYAAPTSADATALRVWRYDRLTDERTLLSDGLADDCTDLEISPDGRYATFLCNGRAYCVDCGAQLRCVEETLTVVPGATAVPLPLLFHGLQADEVATLSLDAESDAPGSVTVDGVPLAPGASRSVTGASVVRYTANGASQGDMGRLVFRLISAETTSEATLALEISSYTELGRVTATKLDVLPVLGFNGDGTSLLALSHAAFNGCDDGGLFTISLDKEKSVETIVCMESELRVSQAVQPPFANQAAWISNHGKLALDSATEEDAILAADGIAVSDAPAASAAAERVAAVLAGKTAIALFGKDGTVQETIDEAGRTLASPKMDYAGRLLFCLRDDGEGACDLCLRRTDKLDAAPTVLATGVTQFAGATMDGVRLLYGTADGFFLLDWTDGEAVRLEAIPAAAAEVHLADNGCWVTWRAEGVLTLARLSGTALEVAAQVDGRTGTAALSADGAQMAFAGFAADFSPGASSGMGIYLMGTPGWISPETPASAWDANVHVLEDETAVLPLPYTGEAACLTEMRATSAQLCGDWALLPPTDGCAFTRLQWTPSQNFVGTASFETRFWNGNRWSAWAACPLTVDNVNDAPEWETAFPQEASVPQGGTQTLAVAAVDPDLANPQPDVLSYGLAGDAPAWASMDAATGLLTLSPPMDAALGENSFHVTATDGTEVIQGEIIVTVTAAEAQAFTLDELLESPESAQEAPLDSAAAWHAAVRGCWAHLAVAAAGWQALSLPGEADCAAVCTLLGVDGLYLYQNGRWNLQSAGVIPAGCGFWANLPESLPGGEVALRPVTGRILETDGFYGALPGEVPPGGRLMAPEDGAWRQDAEWRMGRPVFLHLEE